MSKSIAILITGIIRQDVGQIVKNIRNIKEQFSYLGIVHIYFQTWEPTEKYSYSKEALERIRQEVHFLLTSPCPEKLQEKYHISTLENPSEHSYNVLCMLYAIGQLCACVTEKYDYMCRLRNDLFIQDDFKVWTDLIEQDINYVYPISLWTYDDCCNDHFGIAKQDDFMKLWKRDLFQLQEDFLQIDDCPEKMLMHKLRVNHMKVAYIIPTLYRYKEVDMVSDGHIHTHLLNGYMHSYITRLQTKHHRVKIFNLKTD